MKIRIKYVYIFLLFMSWVQVKAQTLNLGKNRFVYANDKQSNLFLLQEVTRRNDSSLMIRSLTIQLKDSGNISWLKGEGFDSLFNYSEVSFGSRIESALKKEDLFVYNRNNMPSNGRIFSEEHGTQVVDFYDNLESIGRDIVFDVTDVLAYKRDSLNTIAEFYSTAGIAGFNYYVFLKDFWVLEYNYYEFESRVFKLLFFDGKTFELDIYYKRLEE